jgi:DeoR/GlpR family transcriptional regulator of sugar metabolism
MRGAGPPRGERHARILAALRANAAVRASELAQDLGVSGETVRRDLDAMGRAGLIDRTYGGAVARPVAAEPALDERARTLVAERSRIGRAAARLVQPGQVLMIDGGSTTLHTARALAAIPGLTVLTNSLAAAGAMGQAGGVRVLVCAGELDAHEGSLHGPETTAFLERFHADTAILGASGLAPDGPGEAHAGMAWVKRAMIARARRVVLVADHTKFGVGSFATVALWSAIGDLVTDAPPPPPLADALRAAAVRVRLAAG